MTTPVIPLADGFAPASRSDWLALVAKTLKGQGVETLIGATPDGLPVQPLYTAEDASAPLGFIPAPRGGARGWDVRATVQAPDPAAANVEALEALAGGAASVLVRIDHGDGRGVSTRDAQALSRVLEGVEPEVAPVALDAGLLGPMAAGWLDEAAKASPNAQLLFNLDPLSAFAAAGVTPGPAEAHLAAAAAAAAKLAETYPKAGLFLASGAVVHEAGGTPAWELAFAAAAALAYAKGLVGAGLPMAEAFSRLTLGLAIDAEPLGGMAKLRAARVLWARIADACGVDAPARIEARSSRRMLTRADRWTNLVRLTSAGFAAAVGGADTIVLGAFTDAAGAPDAFALRIARNTQLVLMEEAHLGRVSDPAGGAWAVEAQTGDLARAAWDHFRTIEAAGGLAAALARGVVAEGVAAARAALAVAIAERRLRILGVTDFKADETVPEAAPGAASAAPAVPALPGADGACPALGAIRLEEMAQ